MWCEELGSFQYEIVHRPGKNNLVPDALSRVCRVTIIHFSEFLKIHEQFLVYSIVWTNPIDDYMSQAKPQRESNPKLVQRFSHNAALYVTELYNTRCKLGRNGVYEPMLCQKKARFCWC